MRGKITKVKHIYQCIFQITEFKAKQDFYFYMFHTYHQYSVENDFCVFQCFKNTRMTSMHLLAAPRGAPSLSRRFLKTTAYLH